MSITVDRVAFRLQVVSELWAIFLCRFPECSLGSVVYRRPVADVLAGSMVDWDWWTCDPASGAAFAVILHGWHENCTVEWVRLLVDSEYN